MTNRFRILVLVNVTLWVAVGALVATEASTGAMIFAAGGLLASGAMLFALRRGATPEPAPEPDASRMAFLTNVSHELRTPLTSIRGFLKLLEERLYEDEEERQEFFDSSRFATTHMLSVIDDTLRSARLDRRALVPEESVVAGGDAAVEVLRMFESLAREKGLALHIESSGVGLVRADGVLLRQVLINLVGNAVKFTARGAVTLRVQDRGTDVRFEVEDTGEGIDPSELDAIFERFHQSDSPTRRADGGIGLGLALSRQLVELMGGSMRAHSDGRGRGARLVFTVPAAAELAAV